MRQSQKTLPFILPPQQKDDIADDKKKTYTIGIAFDNQIVDFEYRNLAPYEFDVLNYDDDIPGFIVEPEKITTSEDGNNATFTVRLTSKPFEDVMLYPYCENDKKGEIPPSNGGLIFTSDNWNEPQTVTVSGKDDEEQELAEEKNPPEDIPQNVSGSSGGNTCFLHTLF